MIEFEENRPKELRKFLVELRMLMDKYQHNIYLMTTSNLDDFYIGFRYAEQALIDEIQKG